MKWERYMGQSLRPDQSTADAERLLTLAIILLDEAGSYIASAYAAHALTILKSSNSADSEDLVSAPERGEEYRPSWGVLVDQQP